jgi:hypothetical protein
MVDSNKTIIFLFSQTKPITLFCSKEKKTRKILFLLQFYSSIKFLAQILSFYSFTFCVVLSSTLPKHPVFSSFINFYLFLLFILFQFFYLLGLFTACFLAHSTLIQFAVQLTYERTYSTYDRTKCLNGILN